MNAAIHCFKPKPPEPTQKRRPTLKRTIDLACFFSATMFDANYKLVRYSDTRCKKPVADARLAAVHVVRRLYHENDTDIARIMQRHRSTIRNADEQIEARRQASDLFDERLTKLEEAFLAYLDLFEA